MPGHQFELWPCHPHPLPDELLSCWLVRVAHSNRLKVQTFCDQMFGKHRQVWNRDIDRMAPRWIINRLSRQTGTNLAEAYSTALCAYRTLLYPRRKSSGILQWILPLAIWHRKRNGHGLQYCPLCLAEDETPYFRKRWRVALYTFCTRHLVMLQDRCPNCQSGVVFQRLELGQYGMTKEDPLSICHTCGFDLRTAPAVEPRFYEDSSRLLFMKVSYMLEGDRSQRFDGGFFNVLHHLCKLIVSRPGRGRLDEYVRAKMGAVHSVFPTEKRCIEECGYQERHHILQLGTWLMADVHDRLVEAWQSKAIRYNLLKRDFRKMPQWYRDIISECSNWRAIV